MIMKRYQVAASHYACYPNPLYPYFALVEEVGEFAGKLAKSYRADPKYTDAQWGSTTGATKLDEDLKKEMGDIMWNMAVICQDRGWDMGNIAQMNLDKLADRAKRNEIKGDGDNR